MTQRAATRPSPCLGSARPGPARPVTQLGSAQRCASFLCHRTRRESFPAKPEQPEPSRAAEPEHTSSPDAPAPCAARKWLVTVLRSRSGHKEEGDEKKGENITTKKPTESDRQTDWEGLNGRVN